MKLVKLLLIFVLFLFSINIILSTNVNNCRTLNENNNYSLTNNLTINSITSSSCFDINSENITFNCNNFSIISNSKKIAFNIATTNNSKFLNCKFENFQDKVFEIKNTYNTHFSNLIFINSSIDLSFDQNSNNNYFYSNYFKSKDNLGLYSQSLNYFNFSNKGNIWGDFTCINLSSNNINCNNPEKYQVLNNIYDNYPISGIFYLNNSNSGNETLDNSTTINYNLNSCQEISSSGNYNFISNINTSSNCFKIKADNVTIDCKGFNLIGDNINSNTAFESDNSDNFTLNNCKIDTFKTAIKLRSKSKKNSFENISISNTLFPVEIDNCDNNFKNIKYNNKLIYFLFNSEDKTISVHNTSYSSYVFCNNDNLEVKDLNIISNNLSTIFNIFHQDEAIFENISITNFSTGFNILDSRNNDFNRINLKNGLNGILFSGSSKENILSNSNFEEISNSQIEFIRKTSYPENNYFYLNYLDLNKINSDNWDKTQNSFSKKISENVLGNYWYNLTCKNIEKKGNFYICTSPSSINLSSFVFDYAPLIKNISSINLKPDQEFQVEFKNPTPIDKFSLNSYFFTVNISSNFKLASCILHLNSKKVPMIIENNTCYIQDQLLKEKDIYYSYFVEAESKYSDIINTSKRQIKYSISKNENISNTTSIEKKKVIKEILFYKFNLDYLNSDLVKKIYLNGIFKENITNDLISINEIEKSEYSTFPIIEKKKFIKVFSIKGMDKYDSEITSAEFEVILDKNYDSIDAYRLDGDFWNKLTIVNQTILDSDKLKVTIKTSGFSTFAIVTDNSNYLVLLLIIIFIIILIFGGIFAIIKFKLIEKFNLTNKFDSVKKKFIKDKIPSKYDPEKYSKLIKFVKEKQKMYSMLNLWRYLIKEGFENEMIFEVFSKNLEEFNFTKFNLVIKFVKANQNQDLNNLKRFLLQQNINEHIIDLAVHIVEEGYL